MRSEAPSRRDMLALGATALVAACRGAGNALPPVKLTGSAKAQDALRDLHARALAAGESRVVLYTPMGNFGRVWDRFARTFPGITIRTATLSGPALMTRIDGELASGNRQGDVVFSGFSDMAALARQGRLVHDVPPTIADLPVSRRAPDDSYQLPSTNVFGLFYNTQAIDPADLPGEFEALLEPRWRRRFGIGKTSGTAVIDVALATIDAARGLSDQQLCALARNAAVVEGGASMLLQSTAIGRFPFNAWVPDHATVDLARRGVPIAPAFPAAISIFVAPGVGVLAGARRPLGARLLKAWMFTPDAQETIVRETYSYGTMPGVRPPTGFPPRDHFALPDLPLASAAERLAAFRLRTKAIWG